MVYDQVDNKGIYDTLYQNRANREDALHNDMEEQWWDELFMPVHTYYKKQKSEPKPLSFGEAFKAARKAGEKTFVWNGKSYGTKTKEEVDAEAKKSDTSKEDSKSELVSKKTPVIEVGQPVLENPWVVYTPRYPTDGNEPSYVAARVYKNIINDDGEVEQVVSNKWVSPYQYDLNEKKVDISESRPWTLVGTHKLPLKKE